MVLALLRPLARTAAAPPAAADPLPAEAQVRAREALAASHSPRGAAAVLRLRGLRDQLSDPRPVDATLTRIAGASTTDSFVRAFAQSFCRTWGASRPPFTPVKT